MPIKGVILPPGVQLKTPTLAQNHTKAPYVVFDWQHISLHTSFEWGENKMEKQHLHFYH